MKRWKVKLATMGLGILTACLGGGCTRAQQQEFAAAVRQQRNASIERHVQEGDPGWDCSQMGNGVCGPVLIDMQHKQVEALNGTFPFVIAKQYATGAVCVWGVRPIPPRNLTALACSKNVLR